MGFRIHAVLLLLAFVPASKARLAARLSQEKNKVSGLNAAQDSACTMNPLGSACTSATEVLNKLNAKIAQLRDRYDHCVFHDLRHKAALYMSQK